MAFKEKERLSVLHSHGVLTGAKDHRLRKKSHLQTPESDITFPVLETDVKYGEFFYYHAIILQNKSI